MNGEGFAFFRWHGRVGYWCNGYWCNQAKRGHWFCLGVWRAMQEYS